MKLTNTPAYCSGCYGANPEQAHVDFEAAWDGPTIQDRNTAEGIDAIVIDDLILCEGCLRAAGELIGLQDPDKTLEALKLSNAEVIQLRKDYAQALVYTSRLEEALAAKQQGANVGSTPQRRAPRPKAAA